jgi:uncharacterized protein YsxB (DUF464 family)
MIYITIERISPSDAQIKAFVIEGHAEYDVPGKDLVCAAVSAISVGIVNAIEALTGVLPISEMEHGLLDVTLPDLADSENDQANQVQLLLEAMLVMLRTIEETYSDYISIQTTYSKGG